MKIQKLAALSVTGLLLAGLAAAAAPASTEDPLVGLAYLEETYVPQVKQEMLQQAQAGTRDIYDQAKARLDGLAEDYLAQAGGGTGGGTGTAQFLPLTLARGDSLELAAGAGLYLQAGVTSLTVSSGALVDLTDGSEVKSGGKLTAGHRYLLAEAAAAVVRVSSDAAQLGVQGSYVLNTTGALQTPFTDLCDTDWYYTYVRYVYEQELFQGVSETVFSPQSPMTRAMLATVLSRMAGSPAGAADAGFTDVPAGAWYADAVNWAAGAGVVNGMGDGLFLPDGSITREQMAVMLYRYAGTYLGRDVSASGSLDGFSDRADISPWAGQALSWAVGAGILNGHDDGTLAPGGSATRAEVAAMLQRFSDFLN